MMKMSARTIILLKTILFLGFIAVNANPSENTDEVQCTSGWQRIHRGCYMFVTDELSWNDALNHCKENSGELTLIQSSREKEELEKYMETNDPGTKKLWVGLARNSTSGEDWRWLDNLPLDAKSLPWSNPQLKTRIGQICGMVDITSTKLQVSATRCSAEQAFICEYHSITPRAKEGPGNEATTIAATELLDRSNDPPASNPPQTTDNCPCRGSSDVLTSDSSDSIEDRLRRRTQALSTDEELYQRFLQSEIEANNAKVMYYSQVTKLYKDALEKQSQYYSSSQTKLDLEINKLREGSTCT